MDRNELLHARILQLASDAVVLAEKIADLTKLDVVAGPQAEERVRDLEGNIDRGCWFAKQIGSFAKATT